MRYNSLVLILLASCLALVACGGKSAPAARDVQPGLWITEPAAGANVDLNQRVSGTVSDTAVNEVWVVVNPVSISTYWVRGRAPVKKDGTWTCDAQIGESGISTGNPYDIRAFALPLEPLAVGDRLTGWPEAGLVSEPVNVIRK